MASWFRWRRQASAARDNEPAAKPEGFDAFVEAMSDKLYRQTLGEGGWAVDVGVYGPALFRRDARRMVQEIALSGTVSGPPTP